jgi:hypothetical protein
MLALSSASTGAGSGATRAADAARVIDRTLRCSTLGWPVRWIVVSALAPVEGQMFEGDQIRAGAGLWTGPDASSGGRGTRRVGGVSLAGVTGGTPGPSYHRTFFVRYGHCQSSASRVRFTTKGLSGGAASALGDYYRCITARRVLVRIRGEFRSPASLRLDRVERELQTRVPVERGEIAVSTVTGKPLAYLSVSGPWKARIFTAPKCVPT